MNCDVALDISALDKGFKAHAHRGIGRYVGELQRYFFENSSADLDIKNFDFRDLKVDSILDRVVDNLPFGKQTVRQQLVYPLRLAGSATKGAKLLHFPAHGDAPAWCKVPYVVTVLDLIPLLFSDLYGASKTNLRFKFGRWLEYKAVKNACKVIAISENTARDVHNILKIPLEKIAVTPLGVNKAFFSCFESRARIQEGDVEYAKELRKHLKVSENRPLILYVGGIDQRKNIPLLLKAFSELLRQSDKRLSVKPQLILAGRIEDDGEFPALRQSINKLDIIDDVVLTGFLQEEDLLRFYTLSSVFVFPSLYEGFGLPVLEAMAAGLPVIAAATSSIPELLGEDGFLVSPYSSEQFVQAFITALTETQRVTHLAAMAREKAKHFTWENTAQKTSEVYQAALARM